MKMTRGAFRKLIVETMISDPDFEGQANFVNSRIGAKEMLPSVLDYMGRGSQFSAAIEDAAVTDFGNMLDTLGIERGSDQAYDAADAYVDAFMDMIDVSPANWRQMLPEQSHI